MLKRRNDVRMYDENGYVADTKSFWTNPLNSATFDTTDRARFKGGQTGQLPRASTTSGGLHINCKKIIT